MYREGRVSAAEIAEMKALHAQGMRIRDIAARAGRHPRTVAGYLTSVPTKSGPPSKNKPKRRKTPRRKIPLCMEWKTVVHMEMPAAIPQRWDDILIRQPTMAQLMAGSAAVRNWSKFSE